MADALRTIRKVIQDHLDNLVLSDVVSGTIVSVNPIRIRIDANIELDEEFIRYDKPLPPAAVGQSATLQRAVKGQKYYVLEKQYWR